MKKLIFVEWNEVNVSIAKRYVDVGGYENLGKLFGQKSAISFSEKDYPKLEPWIQWVSVHTGLTADEHQVFRLGDIEKCSYDQIFEKVEKCGYSVAAISAMNARNNLVKPAFFIPDPWTDTSPDKSLLSRKVYQAVSQAVNDNSQARIEKASYLWLLVAFLWVCRFSNLFSFVKLLWASRNRKWCKALFLDVLLAEIFIKLNKRDNPDFSTLFMNGFAHIQHHYFFNSKYYDGSFENPSWYINKDQDPFDDAIWVYDFIFGRIFKTFEGKEILVATGLQQRPYEKKKYMYRLSNHMEFLRGIGVEFTAVMPRMTSDFTIYFDCERKKCEAVERLQKVKINGDSLFGTIDVRDDSLFVMSDFSDDLNPESTFFSGDINLGNPADHLVFVALKNGMHDGFGTVWSTMPESSFGNLDGNHVWKIHDYILTKFSS